MQSSISTKSCSISHRSLWVHVQTVSFTRSSGKLSFELIKHGGVNYFRNYVFAHIYCFPWALNFLNQVAELLRTSNLANYWEDFTGESGGES